MVNIKDIIPVGNSLTHKHLFEEVYYITKGRGMLYISDNAFSVLEGDFYIIPKDAYHSLEGTLELVVVTHPPFDPGKVTYR